MGRRTALAKAEYELLLLLGLSALVGCGVVDNAQSGFPPQAEAAKPPPQHYNFEPYVDIRGELWLSLVGSDRVFFAYDSSDLEADARTTLDAWVKALNKLSNLKISIQGHCDERGTREYNLALGDRRAEAVRRYLVAHGISATRLRTVSYGKERPSVPGNDDTAWAQNRNAVSIPE